MQQIQIEDALRKLPEGYISEEFKHYLLIRDEEVLFASENQFIPPMVYFLNIDQWEVIKPRGTLYDTQA